MKPNSLSHDHSPTKNTFATSYFRAVHNAVNPYTQVRNETVRDSSLSFGALGLLTYIFSHSANWKIFPRTLWKERKEGLQRIYTLFNELIEAGYACRLTYREKKPNGKFGRQVFGYAFFEVKASQQDRESVQEEFKKFYRNCHFCKDGTCDSVKCHIEKEQKKRKPMLKETTTPAPKSPAVSLSLFDPNRKYFHGVSEERILEIKAAYKEALKKGRVLKPEAWITKAVQEKWHFTPSPEDKEKVKLQESQERIKVNREKAQDLLRKYPQYVRVLGDTLTFKTSRLSFGASFSLDIKEFERNITYWEGKIEEIERAKSPLWTV